MNVNDLPAVNATLNALSTLFILAGWTMIRLERKAAHVLCMASALVTSAAFLACYLVYHWLKEGHVTRFTHPGWPKVVYLLVLGTHTPLAVVVLPLLILTVVPAVRSRFEAHRRMARWTLPLWLYVSVTGVFVYLMLYIWFPSGKI